MPRKNCGAHSSKATDRPAINWCRSNVRFLTNRCRSNNRFSTRWSRSSRRFARKRCGWRSRRRARRAGCRRCGGVKFDQVKVRGRLVGLRPHTRPTIEWMTKASWSRHCRRPSKPFGTGLRITAISLRVAGLWPGRDRRPPHHHERRGQRLRNLQCPPACAEAIVRKGEWAPARRRVRAQKPIAFDRPSDWL